MNLPTRCCYVKVHEKPAVKITSLKVRQPKVAEKELVAVLGEYKKRYQRSEQEAADVLRKEEERMNVSGNVPIQKESADTVFDHSNRFHNPFAAGTPKEKENKLR
jgi:hypothetical protein